MLEHCFWTRAAYAADTSAADTHGVALVIQLGEKLRVEELDGGVDEEVEGGVQGVEGVKGREGV